jgi:hypothetical protein
MLLFSTFSAWYEGSELRDKPWEWDYSAIFSKWGSGTVTAASDISGFDHFIYAAKFKPIFPLLMTMSILYILVLTAIWMLKIHSNKLFLFFIILGLALIASSSLTYQSPAKGFVLFTWLFIVTGLSSFITSAILKFNLSFQTTN